VLAWDLQDKHLQGAQRRRCWGGSSAGNQRHQVQEQQQVQVQEPQQQQVPLRSRSAVVLAL
jgi:hypothetical protein